VQWLEVDRLIQPLLARAASELREHRVRADKTMELSTLRHVGWWQLGLTLPESDVRGSFGLCLDSRGRQWALGSIGLVSAKTFRTAGERVLFETCQLHPDAYRQRLLLSHAGQTVDFEGELIDAVALKIARSPAGRRRSR
jgi:hypothetical protein